MKNKIKWLGLVGFLVVILGVWGWLYYPLPQYKGVKVLHPLAEKVDVYTDKYGVPHVFAENEKDLFFTAGYIAARERLFQLSMVALAVKGELSSVLGKDFLKTDIYLKTWRIERVARQLIKNMKPENRKIFKSFCDGINHWIEESSDNLPLEFKLLGFSPSKWDPVIVAGYTRMMAHEMSGSWKPEIVFGAVKSYFGEEKLKELVPNDEYDIPTISENLNKTTKPIFDEILKQEIILRDFFGDFSADIGSNSWVVSGEKSITGKPFLANDPHLAFSQPPRWYEIHLSGGRFNVSGVCLAGIPMPVIGQNEDAAWGFTNSMVDDLDFFIEKINPDNENQYFYDNEWKDFLIEKETIPLSDGRDTVITIRTSVHGPVINNIHPLLNNKSVITMSWTGHWITNEMDAWVKMTTMKNWDDFTDAVKNFGVPGQNIVYADRSGNIGWRPAVFIPIRREGFSMVPRPGHDKNFDWKGKVPFEAMPYILNPDEGFISTANNRTIDKSFPYYISGLWADPSRADRIREMLGDKDRHTIDDMKLIQLDHTSNFAKDVLPYILEANIDKNNEGQSRARYELENWDAVEDVNSVGALYFHMFIKLFFTNVYGDELSLLGDSYLEAYTSLKYLTHRKLRELFLNKDSSWLDNINTKDKVEKIDEIIVSTLGETHKEIVGRYGKNRANWKWGDSHSLTHKHVLSKIKILNYLFSLNVGPYRSGGSSLTPNAGGFSYSKPFNQTSGASMRRVVDFSNLNETHMVLPTGQSGLNKSPFYKNQADLFHNGEYRVTVFDKQYIIKSKDFNHLKLVPKL